MRMTTILRGILSMSGNTHADHLSCLIRETEIVVGREIKIAANHVLAIEIETLPPLKGVDAVIAPLTDLVMR